MGDELFQAWMRVGRTGGGRRASRNPQLGVERPQIVGTLPHHPKCLSTHWLQCPKSPRDPSSQTRMLHPRSLVWTHPAEQRHQGWTVLGRNWQKERWVWARAGPWSQRGWGRDRLSPSSVLAPLCLGQAQSSACPCSRPQRAFISSRCDPEPSHDPQEGHTLAAVPGLSLISYLPETGSCGSASCHPAPQASQSP